MLEGVFSEESSEEHCIICMEGMVENYREYCPQCHLFLHHECLIETLYSKVLDCPKCRSIVTKPNYIMNMINHAHLSHDRLGQPMWEELLCQYFNQMGVPPTLAQKFLKSIREQNPDYYPVYRPFVRLLNIANLEELSLPSPSESGTPAPPESESVSEREIVSPFPESDLDSEEEQ